MKKNFEVQTERAFAMEQDIDNEIRDAEIRGDEPTDKFFDILDSAIKVYNYYAGLANDCEDCNFRFIKYLG